MILFWASKSQAIHDQHVRNLLARNKPHLVDFVCGLSRDDMAVISTEAARDFLGENNTNRSVIIDCLSEAFMDVLVKNYEDWDDQDRCIELTDVSMLVVSCCMKFE